MGAESTHVPAWLKSRQSQARTWYGLGTTEIGDVDELLPKDQFLLAFRAALPS